MKKFKTKDIYKTKSYQMETNTTKDILNGLYGIMNKKEDIMNKREECLHIANEIVNGAREKERIKKGIKVAFSISTIYCLLMAFILTL